MKGCQKQTPPFPWRKRIARSKLYLSWFLELTNVTYRGFCAVEHSIFIWRICSLEQSIKYKSLHSGLKKRWPTWYSNSGIRKEENLICHGAMGCTFIYILKRNEITHVLYVQLQETNVQLACWAINSAILQKFINKRFQFSFYQRFRFINKRFQFSLWALFTLK